EEAAATGTVRVDDVREIRRAADRAAELTGQLLAFARRQVIAPRVIVPGVIVGRAHRMLVRVLGEAIEIATVVPSSPWRIRADPAQLEQVVLNLALNARDAMPDGGRLDLTVDHVSVAHGERHA